MHGLQVQRVDFYFQDHCHVCKNLKQNNSCVEECAENHYSDETSKTCHPCHQECQACWGSTSDRCIKCKNFKLVTNNGTLTTSHCIATCPDLYPRIDSTGKMCLKAAEINLVMVIPVSIVVTIIVFIAAAMGAYFWIKKRQQNKSRFAFEDPIKLDIM